MSDNNELKVYCKRLNKQTKKYEEIWVVPKNIIINGITLEEHLNDLNEKILEADNLAKENIAKMEHLEKVFADTIRGFITKWENYSILFQ